MKNLLFTALAIIAFAGSNVAQVPNYVPSNGLVGWWPFNGNANDESANGNNGTVNGATLTSDRSGSANSAYSFNGTNNNIVIPNSNSLNVDQITLAVWYLANANKMAVIVKNNPSNCNDFSYGLYHQYSWSNYGPGLYTSSGFGNCSTTLREEHFGINGIVPSQEWVFIVFTKDNTGNSKTYFNGSLIESYSGQNLISCNSSNSTLRFGGPHWNTYDMFSGQIDDIGIWNRALTDQEIQALYNGCSVASNSIVGNNTPEVFTAETYSCTNNTGSTYQWTISNGVITAGQGTNSVSVLWAGTGLGTISVQETTSANCQGDTISVNVVVIPTGLEEINQSAIKFYPNPANSNMTIDYGNFAMMNGYQLKIQNSLGQQVFQTNISQQTDNLSLSTWGGNGIYFVHIIDPQGNTIDIRKIVLQ